MNAERHCDLTVLLLTLLLFVQHTRILLVLEWIILQNYDVQLEVLQPFACNEGCRSVRSAQALRVYKRHTACALFCDTRL